MPAALLAAMVLLALGSCQPEPEKPGSAAVTATPTPGVVPRELDVEFLYWPGACNSLEVDDEWIYLQSGGGTYRAPKRPGEGPRALDDFGEWEQIGIGIPEGAGRVIADGEETLYWGSSEALIHNARLYAYHKDTGQLDEVDLGFTYLVVATHVTERYVVVVAADCVVAAVVDRATLAVHLLERPDAEYTGGSMYASTVHRDHLFCPDGGIVYQAPLSGGTMQELAPWASGLQGLVGWGDYLLFAGGGQPQSAAGFIDLTTSPATVTVAKSPISLTESYGIYSERHKTIYWLARYIGASFLILLDTETMARAHVPMPSYVAPSSGIAQDDEYLYWGEVDDGPALSRTRKLTVAEVRERFGAPQERCDRRPTPTQIACWEDAPVPGLTAGFVTPSDVPSGKPLLALEAMADAGAVGTTDAAGLRPDSGSGAR